LLGEICGAWPRRDAPRCQFHSWNSPGCAAPNWGGTHCGYAEINNCLETGRASLPAGVADRQARPLATLGFVSIIRDPVDRVLSEFFYWRKSCRPGPQWTAELCAAAQKKGAAGFRAWVLSPFNNGANRMTKMLSNDRRMKAPAPTAADCVSFDATQQGLFWGERYNATFATGLEDAINKDATLLKDAIQTVESRFVFVGIQDEMEASLRLLHYMLAGRDNATLTAAAMPGHSHSSRGTRGGKMQARVRAALANDAELVRTIKARNWLDMQLYEHIAARFGRAMRELPGGA